jgi:hypothetical protein
VRNPISVERSVERVTWTFPAVGADSQETERDLQAVIELSHRRGRERSQDTKDIALLYRQQVYCDERRIPGEPTAWLSRQLDQMLRGLVLGLCLGIGEPNRLPACRLDL